MTRKNDEDRYVPKAGGRWELVLPDGTRFLLRRPNLGEQRRYEELLEEMAQDQRAARLAEREDREANPYPQREFEARLIGWWRLVVGELNTVDGAELPEDDDDLPPWFIEANVLGETRVHWRSVPYGPGGSPTHAAAQAQEKSTQQATRALELLSRTSGGVGLQ